MVQFCTLNFVELGRTILVSLCGLKKSHYYSRVSLHETQTKNYHEVQKTGLTILCFKSILKTFQNMFKIPLKKDRTRRLKSALYLRLKKRKRLFLKKLETSDFFQKMSHSAKKCKRGTLWALLTYSVPKYQKTRKGDSFETLKNFRKKSHSAEKIERGDPLVSSGFVGYVKKVKNERGDPLH